MNSYLCSLWVWFTLYILEGLIFADPYQAMRPCPPDSTEYKKALEQLIKFNNFLAKLSPFSDVRPAQKKFNQLLELPCLQMALHTDGKLKADSAWALKTFWTNGGEDWLMSYLNLGLPNQPYLQRVVSPSDMPITLTLESKRKHPLFSLLCSVKDTECLSKTSGWKLRAELKFIGPVNSELLSEEAQKLKESDKKCLEKVRSLKEDLRFSHWLDCVKGFREENWTFPLGAIRMPEEGWFYIHGRRGHYPPFCDEIRAYDLKTGSAYIVQSCLNQVRRILKKSMGFLLRENLREAIWMVLMANELKESFTYASYYDLPREILPILPQEDMGILTKLGTLIRSAKFSTEQTKLAWSYVVQGKLIASDSLTWPNDFNNPGKDHAVDLINIAENSFVSGCPSAPLPKYLVFGNGKTVVPHLDATSESLDTVWAKLLKTLKSIGTSCLER